jgi:hypothetical protein
MTIQTTLPLALATCVALVAGAPQAAPDKPEQRTESVTTKKGLTCKTSYGNTGGWVQCTGKGTWRAVADCTFSDETSKWITQGKHPHREYLECTVGIHGMSYEVR